MPPKKSSKAKKTSKPKPTLKTKANPESAEPVNSEEVEDEETKEAAEAEEVEAAEAEEVEAAEDKDDKEDMPELEYVSGTMKERYEYKPVLRAEIVYRNPDDRVTSEVMTRFELCEIVSIRAKQLEKGHKVFTDIGELTNPIDIAKKEVVDKKCPLSIVRMITDKVAEKWQVNEMAIPHDAL